MKKKVYSYHLHYFQPNSFFILERKKEKKTYIHLKTKLKFKTGLLKTNLKTKPDLFIHRYYKTRRWRS